MIDLVDEREVLVAFLPRELLNWFLARGQFAAGVTEGFNNKARITTRRAYGFRTYEHAEIALYHALGDLPVPPWLTHRFC